MKALLSVYEKENPNILDLAGGLHELGVELYASGGTADTINAGGLRATKVGINILNHRVATLLPEVHGGLLADPKLHLDEMVELGYSYFDIVCVDLYPFEAELERDGATEASILEKTDVGGIALLHAAAKGRRIVISRPELRGPALAWIKAGQPDDEFVRTALAATAEYDAACYLDASARYLMELTKKKRPETISRASHELLLLTAVSDAVRGGVAM